ncbi:MAG: ribose ABC transporter permease, partial [Chloroflexi bacterium]
MGRGVMSSDGSSVVTAESVPRPRRAVVAPFLRDYGMILVLVLLAGLLEIAQPRTLSPTNLLNLARQVSITALIAAGETLVILSANVDLSVGAVLTFAGVLSAGVLRDTGSPPLAIGIGLLAGAIAGLANGVFVAKGRLASFIVTLAVQGILAGTILLYTNASPIPVNSAAFTSIGQGHVLGIPVPIVIAVLVYLTLWVVLSRTTLGRYIYAIGGNEEAARLAGVNVDRYKIAIFVLAGALSALSGIVLTSRLGSGVPTLGAGQELIAITVVVLGGTSLFGGEGRIWGTLVGAAIL